VLLSAAAGCDKILIGHQWPGLRHSGGPAGRDPPAL